MGAFGAHGVTTNLCFAHADQNVAYGTCASASRTSDEALVSAQFAMMELLRKTSSV